MQREPVLVRVNRDGSQAQFGCGAHDANRDFTSVGNEKLAHGNDRDLASVAVKSGSALAWATLWVDADGLQADYDAPRCISSTTTRPSSFATRCANRRRATRCVWRSIAST